MNVRVIRIPATMAILFFLIGGGCGDRSGVVSGEETAGPKAGATGTAGGQWFIEGTAACGIDFVHESGGRGEFHLIEMTGGGVALFDYDNDGDLDIYLTNGNHAVPEVRTSDAVRNRLYRQEPDGRFVDVTAAAGLGDGGYGIGVAVGDIDNDGDVDVFVANYGPDRLYLNQGDGTFEDVTVAAGIEVAGWSCSSAFFDYDRDGFLDLFITQYVEYDPHRHCTDPAGRPDYCGPTAFVPVSDVLLHNNGDPGAPGFTDVSEQAGLTSGAAAAGLGVVCEDLNGDGWIDVFVANDGYANHLWINQGDGTFHDAAFLMGAAYNIFGQEEAGMGVVAADFDNDGDLDLFLTHLERESNTFYANRGAAVGFDDVTAATGLGASSMTYTGFGTVAIDVELDGDLDIVVVGGRVNRTDPHPLAVIGSPWDRYVEPNLFFLNDGNARFHQIEEEIETLCGPLEITRGLAVGDIDADGDLDLVITNIQGPARLYFNQAPRRGHWLIVRAYDPDLHRDAIGARVTLIAGGRRFLRTVSRAFSYVSSSDPRVHFGLGSARKVDAIEVWWPDGLREQFEAQCLDCAIEVHRGTGRAFRGAEP